MSSKADSGRPTRHFIFSGFGGTSVLTMLILFDVGILDSLTNNNGSVDGDQVVVVPPVVAVLLAPSLQLLTRSL